MSMLKLPIFDVGLDFWEILRRPLKLKSTNSDFPIRFPTYFDHAEKCAKTIIVKGADFHDFIELFYF